MFFVVVTFLFSMLFPCSYCCYCCFLLLELLFTFLFFFLIIIFYFSLMLLLLLLLFGFASFHFFLHFCKFVFNANCILFRLFIPLFKSIHTTQHQTFIRTTVLVVHFKGVKRIVYIHSINYKKWERRVDYFIDYLGKYFYWYMLFV